MNSIESWRTLLERKKGQKDQVEIDISTAKLELKKKNKNLRRHEKARELIREAGLITQQSLSFHISEITSLALDSVFEKRAYKLLVEFIERRNKTECDLLFSRDESKVDPMDASGGGAVDVASFALRIASWSMNNPRKRNTIILDEPLKNLSKKYQEKGSNMLKEVSEKLGIQFIIITHEDILTTFADKEFKVDIAKKRRWEKSFIR